jgi:acyl-coenzyme A thioesterase PaaI-like protein
VVFAVQARPEIDNGLGLVHGGVLATLMDFACSAAASTELPNDAYLTTIVAQATSSLSVVRITPPRAGGARTAG